MSNLTKAAETGRESSTPTGIPATAGRNAAATSCLSADARLILGGTIVARYEDPAEFESYLYRIVEAMAPLSFYEETLVASAAVAHWDARRARRAIVTLLNVEPKEAVVHILHRAVEIELDCKYPQSSDFDREANRILKAGVDKDAAFLKILASLGLGPSAVTETAYTLHLEKIERLERIAHNADQRRLGFIREVYRHRKDLAASLELELGYEDEEGKV
jgi:hypothetical protein